MSTDKWIICYYDKESNNLITTEYEFLETALKMIDTLLDTYGYDFKYKMFKGCEWL